MPQEMLDMQNTEKFIDLHIEKDKWFCPYLLSASFSGFIKFEGNLIENGILLWKFSPKPECIKLIQLLETQQEPHIPLQHFINAIDTFWKQVSSVRNEEKRNGNRRL